MSILSARELSKAYGPQTLFTKAALTISAGERVGLLGANGMGKSTLLRVLAGVEPVDEGVLERQRGASVLYLPQEPKLAPDQTPQQIVAAGLAEWHAASERHAELSAQLASADHDHNSDNTALLDEQARLADTIERLGGWDQGHRALDMLHRLGIERVDQPVGSMSGGEQRRVALAKILVAQPQLAILDEPTNHLDVETIEYLEEYLAERFSGAVLLVTHDRYVLDAVANRILELEGGTLTEYRGNYSDYLEQKAERLAHGARAEDNRLNRLRRERAWLARGPKARSTKQKARIQRAEALMAIEAPKDAARAELSGLEAGASQSGKMILELIDLRVEIAERTLIAGLSLHMVQGARMGIVGPNGVGKTTLLKVVAGELAPSGGSAALGTRTKVAYFDQARAGLHDDWSVFDNVAEREGAERDGGGRVQIGELVMDLRTYLERFLFDGSKQRQKVGALSGGERARVALAKALRAGANMLLLDEPTNDLDIATLGELEDLLCSWPGCVIAVSHDRSFLNRVATSILAFEPNGRVVHYAGDYDSYRSQRASARRSESAAPAERKEQAKSSSKVGSENHSVQPPAKLPVAASNAARAKPLSRTEKAELAGIIDEIAKAETLVAKLEAALADKDTYGQGPEAVKRVRAEHDAARNEVARLTLRWEELEARSHSAN